MNYKYKVMIDKKAERFLSKLSPEQLDIMFELIGMLEKFGYELTIPYSKKVHTRKHTIYELRDHKYGNRLYYFYSGNYIYIVTNGGKKNTQDKDIALADKLAGKILK